MTLETAWQLATSSDRRIWRRQTSQLIERGFHQELGLSPNEYRETVPPPFYDPHHRPAFLVDNRVRLRELQLANISNFHSPFKKSEIDYHNIYYQESDNERVPYWIHIRDGSPFLQLAFIEGLVILKRRRQHPLTLSEAVALSIHYPRILRRYPIYVGAYFDPDGNLNLLPPKDIGILIWNKDSQKVNFCKGFDKWRTGYLVSLPWHTYPLIGLPSCDGEFETDPDSYAGQCYELIPEED